MEKSAKNFRKSKSTRLLIKTSLIFFIVLTFQQNLFAHYYSRYVLRPVNEYIFEDEETVFETIIPNIRPSDILVTAQNLPEKVTFILSDTTEVFNEEGERSTRVRIVYKFEKAGFFKMSPIASRIRYGAYNLTVADVTVLHNPQTIQPEVRLIPTETEKKEFFPGDRIKLNLTVEFAEKIESFHVSILEDSAMVKTYENFKLPLTVDSFTDEIFNIASFDFIPLKEGKVEVPQIEVKVRTWKGAEKVVSSEPLSFVIQNTSSKDEHPSKQQTNSTNSSAQKIINSSNTMDISQIDNKDNEDFTEKNETEFSEDSFENANIQKLAELRNIERKKLFTQKAKKERRQLEKELGIEKSENEFSFVIVYILMFLFFASVVTLIMMVIHKKNHWIIIISILSAILLIGGLVCGIYAHKQYCLLLNDRIYSVPEKNSEVYFTLKPGTRVSVKGKSENWIWVTYGDSSSGWIQRSDVIFLGK